MIHHPRLIYYQRRIDASPTSHRDQVHSSNFSHLFDLPIFESVKYAIFNFLNTYSELVCLIFKAFSLVDFFFYIRSNCTVGKLFLDYTKNSVEE